MNLNLSLKTLLTFFIIVLIASTAYATATHELELSEDYVSANTTLKLDCQSNCPLNLWNINYNLPEDSELIYIGDSIGQIDEYSVQNGVVDASTNSGPAREEEYVEIYYKINEPSEKVVEELKTYELSFSGFEDQETAGTIESSEIISAWIAPGFEVSYQEDVRFNGEGPLSISLNVGEGNRTEYYEVFGDKPEADLDKAYEMALGTVGHQQNFERFPIVFYSSIDYRNEVSEWSAGEYGGGLIKIKESDELKPVVVHETVHGLNHDLLSWDQTDSAWFDEGVATHAEDLTRVSLEGRNRTSELFGDDVSFQDEGYIYTIPPRGDREELWEYYQSEEDSMKHWAPSKGNREFGYAYSELIVKKYVKNGGELTEIYEEVDPGVQIDSNEEKWDLYGKHLDLRPCERENRADFDHCLDEINQHEFEVQAASRVNETDELEIEKVEVPERQALENPGIAQQIMQELNLFLNAFTDLVSNLGDKI